MANAWAATAQILFITETKADTHLPAEPYNISIIWLIDMHPKNLSILEPYIFAVMTQYNGLTNWLIKKTVPSKYSLSILPNIAPAPITEPKITHVNMLDDRLS